MILIAALAASVPLLRLWLRARRKRRYAQADPAERLQMDLETLLRDLRGKGYPRAPEESLRQYFERLPGFLIRDGAEVREMAALYDRTFFALKAPSEAELKNTAPSPPISGPVPCASGSPGTACSKKPAAGIFHNEKSPDFRRNRGF